MLQLCSRNKRFNAITSGVFLFAYVLVVFAHGFQHHDSVPSANQFGDIVVCEDTENQQLPTFFDTEDDFCHICVFQISQTAAEVSPALSDEAATVALEIADQIAFSVLYTLPDGRSPPVVIA